MLRTSLIVSALAGASLVCSAPAHAYTPEELDCVVREAPADAVDAPMQNLLFESGLADQVPGDQLAKIYPVVLTCAERIGLPDDLLSAYATYALATVAGEETRSRMAALGMDIDRVDQTLGIDWRNPDAGKFVIDDAVKDDAAALMSGMLPPLALSPDKRIEALLYVGFYMAMAQGWSNVIDPLAAHEG